MRPSEELPEQETAAGGSYGGESSFPLRPDDDVSRARSATSREPDSFLCLTICIKFHKKLAPGARETTYLDYNGRERWLPWTGYLVPTCYECLSTTELRPPSQSIPAWTPNHPAQDVPYWAIPPAGGSAVHWQPTWEPFSLAPHWRPN
ncbi:hypothetical protein E2C01_078125 [Portunus trituberculatus]|uniref:Uncharacterized protein n=1 Tax=Portunus trituberculatus TaxID=210409 RepID=A0A5B7IP40_PORTR|nr:hypothetical protein [Portunus trituberculatus]